MTNANKPVWREDNIELVSMLFPSEIHFFQKRRKTQITGNPKQVKRNTYNSHKPPHFYTFNPAIPEHLQFFSRQANSSNFFKSIRNSASYGLLRQFRSFVSRNKWNLMGVNWEGLGEGVIAFFKKELDCKSECSKWGTFLTPNKKRVTLSTTLTTLTLIVFKEGQNSFHRSFHIMKIGKNHQFCCRIIWAEGCSQTGGGGKGEGIGWWLRCMWLPFLPFLHTKK